MWNIPCTSFTSWKRTPHVTAWPQLLGSQNRSETRRVQSADAFWKQIILSWPGFPGSMGYPKMDGLKNGKWKVLLKYGWFAASQWGPQAQHSPHWSKPLTESSIFFFIPYSCLISRLSPEEMVSFNMLSSHRMTCPSLELARSLASGSCAYLFGILCRAC